MLVALTVTPALCLVLLSTGRALGSPRVAAAARAQARLRRASSRACIRRPSPAIADRGRRSSLAGVLIYPTLGVAAASELQGARLPHALAHRAGDVGPGGEADLRPRLPGPAGDPGRAQLRLAHRPGAAVATRSTASYFGENWISVDEDVDYDKTLASIHSTVEGYPGPLPRRADLPARADQGGADGDERVDRRADLRARPRGAAREGGRDRRAHRRRSTASSTPIRDFAEDLPHVEVELDLAAARRYGLKPGDVRRQIVDAAGQRGGRRHLLRRQGLRRARVEHPVGARQPDRRPRSSRSTRRTAAGPSRRGGRRARRADAEQHRARAAVAPDRRGRQRRGSRPRLGRRRRRGRAWRASASRASTTPRCWASPPS